MKIGDEVVYKGEKFVIGDMAYARLSEDNEGNRITPTTVKFGGALCLRLRDTEQDSHVEWALAEECSLVASKDKYACEAVLFDWIAGMPTRDDNAKFLQMLPLLAAVQYDKEGTYGSSWKGKGELRGIMANIDRKYDRLDKILNDEATGERPLLPSCSYKVLVEEGQEDSIGESKIDAVADLANYCILYMTYLQDTYPGAFEVWVRKNVPKYLLDKIQR